jgi:hypothetical protein
LTTIPSQIRELGFQRGGKKIVFRGDLRSYLTIVNLSDLGFDPTPPLFAVAVSL